MIRKAFINLVDRLLDMLLRFTLLWSTCTSLFKM